jgi:hypothetical protein
MKSVNKLLRRAHSIVGFALPIALVYTQTVVVAPVFDYGAPDLVSGTQMTEFRVAENFTLTDSAAITNILFSCGRFLADLTQRTLDQHESIRNAMGNDSYRIRF